MELTEQLKAYVESLHRDRDSYWEIAVDATKGLTARQIARTSAQGAEHALSALHIHTYGSYGTPLRELQESRPDFKVTTA